MTDNDLDNYYCIEFHGNKGWEIYWSYFNLEDALNRFKRVVRDTPSEDSIDQWRLTSPKLV